MEQDLDQRLAAVEAKRAGVENEFAALQKEGIAKCKELIAKLKITPEQLFGKAVRANKKKAAKAK